MSLRLTGTVRLADALNQLHLLLPALDESKHYFQGEDEIEKLFRSGEGWLATHPERELIVRRYLARRTHLTRTALERLGEADDVPTPAVEPAAASPLRVQRHEAVLAALREVGARSVIDLGCGPGDFLTHLVAEPAFTRIAGTDVSARALEIAARRLHLEDLSPRQAERIELFVGALTYRDARLAGFDAAVLMEVIEHVDPGRLPALERVVFAEARPAVVLVTTPNRENNACYPQMTGMRHPDHRFEWSRQEFRAWAERVGDEHGYRVELRGIGDEHPDFGTPTQMAVMHRG